MLASYFQFSLKYPSEERIIFGGIGDVLRADDKLSLCLIVRPEIPQGEEHHFEGEPPDIDQFKLVEKWKTELIEKYSIKENRVFILKAAPGGSQVVEAWVVPPGAPLPDPHADEVESAGEGETPPVDLGQN